MQPSLSELKVTPSFCFAFKVPDNRAVTNLYRLTILEKGKESIAPEAKHKPSNEYQQKTKRELIYWETGPMEVWHKNKRKEI